MLKCLVEVNGGSLVDEQEPDELELDEQELGGKEVGESGKRLKVTGKANEVCDSKIVSH